MTVSDHYRAHVELLERLAEAGCEMSAKSLAALALLAEGWRYGDPDPVDDTPPDGDDGEPVRKSNVALLRRAA